MHIEEKWLYMSLLDLENANVVYEKIFSKKKWINEI